MSEFKIKLIELLHNDAFLKTEQLAVMLGASEAEIKTAIQELEQDGIIMGYGAIVNTEKLNENKVSALI